MHLKTLTLKGFKSFADPASLDFEEGVAVIVGPNGSGKSNVVDAIGWVLGAQAPSAVRSTKMDDVIFAGTQSRPALGRAEVALTIDNSSGVLPVEFTEVTIARTLWRSGESEYALNGVPCRLLDIQELLSDAGVGRQQHVIVSQGQIDAVLNARPEDRRLIIEEAAGVLKYRKRKEKAERRLTATESNLTRLQDLLREVRRQLRPLERQAEAARRHGEVVEELTALRIFAVGREIEGLLTRRSASQQARTELVTSDESLKRRLRELDDAVRRAENELSAVGGGDLGDTLALFESLREKAKGQLMVIAERRRGVAREREAYVDQEVVATLEVDAAEARREHDEVERSLEVLQPERRALEADEASLAADRAVFEQELADEGAQQRLPLGDRPVGFHRADAEPAEPPRRRPIVERLTAARRDRERADEELQQAEQRRREAETAEQRWQARVEALALALDEARARAGADRLDGVEGVMGTLLDLVAIDEGWESAFGAAVGEAITAVVVADVEAGRRALEALAGGDLTGAVLSLDLDRAPRSAAAVGHPLRPHVRAERAEVSRLLDHLLAGVTEVEGWPAALDASAAHPDAIIVTRRGDRFGPAGWRVGDGGAQVTAAALDEARRRADEAAAENRSVTVDLSAARSAAEVARRHEVETSRQLGRAFDDARAALDARARELTARRTDVEVRRAGLDQRRLVLERRLADLGRKLSQHAGQREAAGERLAGLDDKDRALGLLSDFSGARLREAEAELGRLRDERRQQSEATKEIAARLDRLRRERSGAERELMELRERMQRAEIEEAEIGLRLEAAVDGLRRDLQVEPEQAMAAGCPPLPDGVGAEARVRELERELRIMGPINPLALQEFEALQERHEFLVEQLDDVKKTRRDLFKVIREIDREIVAVFAAAFADVSQNFQDLFETLFPGGRGRLKLTDPENLLETGLEVEARPSGKNVKKLSLLSGGERSLTALAFLFAVFRSRPSPFYVMDEVEAALDDINLHRFLELVAEFRRDAQLVIVSHQKRTMEAGDCLYGVSMKPGGSSRVVSEKIAEIQLV